MILRKLMEEANVSCTLRGHKMIYQIINTHQVIGHCEKCGRHVQVTDRPAPNDITIGGEAVALDCEKTSIAQVIS